MTFAGLSLRPPVAWVGRLLGAGGVLLGPISPRAETVALWLFDEPADLAPGGELRDAGSEGHDLRLGRGGSIVPGKFGHALRPVPAAAVAGAVRAVGHGEDRGKSAAPPGPRPTPAPKAGNDERFAALRAREGARARGASWANPTDGSLNAREGDWTLECWLRLDAAAKDEGVIFEIGAGPRGENELVTRLSVLPQENAFAVTALTPATAKRSSLGEKLIEFPNPEGPPTGVARVRTTTLALLDFLLPREAWMHVAFVYAGASGNWRLFVDGRLRAVARAEMMALPQGDAAYVALGTDGRSGRPFPGALDEMRISNHAAYVADFAVPASFAAP